MATLINLIGQKFDKLLVLEKAESRKRHVYWKCQCDCGNICEKSSEYLRSKILPRDCGCSKQINIKKQQAEERKNRLVGEKFGRLTVIKRLDKRAYNNRCFYWLCQCECGNFKEVPSELLTNGHTRSCGCLAFETHFKDITNQRFGKLIALYPDKEKPNNWICKCDCGNEKSILGSNLRRGLTKSCGCINYSIGENNIKNILTSNNFSFISQYHPNDGYGFYDFAILDSNNNIIRLIEFDGEQHYKSTRGTWKNHESLEKIQERDNIKNQYAFSHNIPLVRIPYWERDKITLEMIMEDQYLIKEDD